MGFVESCSNMYVNMDSYPSIEILIKGIESSSKTILIDRLTNYYPDINLRRDDKELMLFTLPYSSHSAKNDYIVELKYALEGIQKGISDKIGDEELDNYEAVDFSFDISIPEDDEDRFLLSLNNESLLDKEGLRFGSLRGQGFILPDGDNSISLGKLSEIKYPKVTFSIAQESKTKVSELVMQNKLTCVVPDMSDLTGEIEKVNRLKDSFERITEHPELLANPKLASYLFDAQKATPTDAEKINNRAQTILETKLNENLNESQIRAIAKAVEAEDLSLIQGPPGTGKSTAIAELIWQLALKSPKSKILLTSEANLAVDNALDKLKASCHNIVKPIRIAAGDKFSAEGLSYAITEMKKWAGIELDDIEKDDDLASVETKEYKSFNRDEVVLNRWLKNIFKRNRIQDESLRKEWFSYIAFPSESLKQKIYHEYVSHCNVIGATCSAISDTNYSASESSGKHKDSRFLKKFKSIFENRSTKLKFDVVIQDEASKATPAELSLPLAYGNKAVVIGDHRQLPPNLDKEDILFKLHMQRLRASSKEEHDKIVSLEQYVRKNFAILEQSHFERLFRQIDDSLKGTFNTQYRMHKDINDVIEQFYVEDGDGLHCGVKNEDREHGIDIPNLMSPSNHVIWINIDSPEIKDGTSRANKGEVEAIDVVLNKLAESESFIKYQNALTGEDKEIGLITFYGSQMKRLNPIVDAVSRKGLNIKMSSVDRFQGMERNIIIVSLVRSNTITQQWKQKPNYAKYPGKGYMKQEGFGFAESPNRLNVALSRAKRLLIIVGNAEHFCSYVNSKGNAIYKNVFDIIKKNENGRVIDWIQSSTKEEKKHKIYKVQMPKVRSVNLNTRDINEKSDTNLRVTETWFTKDKLPCVNPHFAVLELSTKAVKLMYGLDEEAVKTTVPFDFSLLKKESDKTETGKGLNEKNEMDMNYFNSIVLKSIRKMKNIMRQNDIDVVYSVATAAYRTAKNRDEIIDRIRETTGINVRILSKREESISTMFAYGITSKYRSTIAQSKHVVMIEQGGGSTEVSIFNQGEYIDSYSINFGTTSSRNMLIQGVSSGATMKEALSRCDQMIRDRMVAMMKNIGDKMQSDVETFCVSVGTAITNATGKRKNALQHDCILDYDQIKAKIESTTERILSEFATIDDFEKWELENKNSNSLDTIITMRLGLPLYLIFMDRFNINKIHVSGTGLWYGIYLQHLLGVND